MALKSRLTQEMRAEINMIPLIDVMLVLLVVFMVTAPLISHAVNIRLPRTAAPSNVTPPTVVRLGIDKDGKLSWDDAPLADNALPARLKKLAQSSPDAEVHLYADSQTPYDPIAKAMAEAAHAGITKLGFESLPQATP